MPQQSCEMYALFVFLVFSVGLSFSITKPTVCMCLGEVHNFDREMKKCLIESFKKTDEEFLQKASEVKPSWKVGRECGH